MKRGNSSKRYYLAALFIFTILIISACKSSGAAAGSAPRKPFIGGTAGITINFLKDNPQPEVTDDTSFGFKAIIGLKNDGEYKIPNGAIKVNLVGFDPSDFSSSLPEMLNRDIDDRQEFNGKRIDAEGNIVDGDTTYVTFPRSNDFTPRKFSGNTEFTFRADACYAYQTLANSKLCILKDMINIRDNSVCRPTESKSIYASAAPVQASNFRQTVIGKDKISFTFDITLSGNSDIFQSSNDVTPSQGFDQACPRNPRDRRQVENKVKVKVEHIPPSDPIITNIQCGGLDSRSTGLIALVNGKRTLTCTADLSTDRTDLEKVIEITLNYNVLDKKETKVLVKHLAESP